MSFVINPIAFYSPEAVAPIVLRAVENNRPFVFDHAEQRRIFHETYVDVVDSCFDAIDEYEREHGVAQAVDIGV